MNGDPLPASATPTIVLALVDGVSDLQLSLSCHILRLASRRTDLPLAAQVLRASPTGAAVTTAHDCTVPVDGPLPSAPTHVIVPGLESSADTAARVAAARAALGPWLRRSAETAETVCAATTGVDILSGAGLGVEASRDEAISVVGNLATARDPLGIITLTLLTIARSGSVALATRLATQLVPHGRLAGLALAFSHEDPDIERARRWIDANIARPFTMRELGEALGMSERTLARRFERGLRTTPLRFTQRLRVERAIELLESTGLSIADVATRVGHRSTTAFRRAFVREVGCLPSEFRQRSEAGGPATARD